MNLDFVSEKDIDGVVYVLRRDSDNPQDTYLCKGEACVLFDSNNWKNNEMIKAAF